MWDVIRTRIVRSLLKSKVFPTSGLGLGLFIVREIARAHGGEVTVRSDKEETVFGVTLPRRNVKLTLLRAEFQRRFRPPLKFFGSSRTTSFASLSSRNP